MNDSAEKEHLHNKHSIPLPAASNANTYNHPKVASSFLLTLVLSAEPRYALPMQTV